MSSQTDVTQRELDENERSAVAAVVIRRPPAGWIGEPAVKHKEPMTRSIDFLNEAKAWGDREGDAVPVPVPAGSAIFHHCLSWHTSPPNLTAGWRRAYITIYLDATCTYDATRAGWHPVSSRVTVPQGAVFNEDAFPTLGPDLPAATLARVVGGAA